MLLRPRQKKLVNRAVDALRHHGNTLAVAPTGAGKTVMLSAAIGEMFKSDPSLKACVVAHRDELTTQNVAKFSRINPHLSTSIVDACAKSWQGDVTFAMVQTLSRERNLADMPPLGLLVIDEAHHARSESYWRIISYAKTLNPTLKLLGMTATPNRGDKKGLYPVFSNVCDQITVGELIASGHLVRPKTFVMDIGAQQKLKGVRKTAGDFDMEEVARIMDTRPINEAVVTHWKEKAGDRQTVVFCSTVEHARHVHQGFLNAGVSAVLVHGEMPGQMRDQALKAYTQGTVQVIVNVAVLTEGWDHPPTSCVVLLRPSSHKSAFIQMVGRGLRPVNPEEHPGMVKNDCIVLDFGTATLTHGSLEQMAKLGDGTKTLAETCSESRRACPECKGEIPIDVSECPLCGFVLESEGACPELAEGTGSVALDEEDFAMTEIDILGRSPFIWIDVNGQGQSFMASGFTAWGGVFLRNGQWRAVGALQKQPATLLAAGKKSLCLAAANDWMNRHETSDSAHKAKAWVNRPATPKQRCFLPEYQNDNTLTCYKASVLMNLKFNAKNIKNALGGYR